MKQIQLLLLIRGLPGSGKSTLAKSFGPTFVHIEADQYFTGNDGIYNFTSYELTAAHKYCEVRTKQSLSLGHHVVVSNTFSKHWEMEAYKQMAVDIPNVQLLTVIAQGNWPNTHNVPEAVIERMRERWQR
jgi:predicted kinase